MINAASRFGFMVGYVTGRVTQVLARRLSRLRELVDWVYVLSEVIATGFREGYYRAWHREIQRKVNEIYHRMQR